MGGHANSNPGHSKPFMRPPSPSPANQGPTNCLTYSSAPKNAAKNITSEKMNQNIPKT